MSELLPRASTTRSIDDFFAQADMEDILERVLLTQPPKELAELRLVNQQWLRLISSPVFSKKFPNKDAILLVCTKEIFVIHVRSLLNSVPIYTTRKLPVIKFPVVSVIGSCDGLVCLMDSSYNLFVISPRNLKYRTVRDKPGYRAYGLGWQVKDSLRSHVLVVVGFGLPHVQSGLPHVQSLRTLNLETNQWSDLKNDSRIVGWTITSLSRNGVFVNGIFAWLGKVNRDDHVFQSIVIYDGNSEKFDFLALPECLNRAGLNLGNLGDDVAAVWENGKKDSIWLIDFENKQFDRIPINIYASFGTDSRPLCFCHGKTCLLLLVDNRRLDLYDLKEDRILKTFSEFSLAFTNLTNNVLLQAIRFRDTFVSPGKWP